MTCLPKTSVHDPTPNVTSQEDLESNPVEANEVQIHLEQGAKSIRFQLCFVGKSDVEAIKSKPDLEPEVTQSLVRIVIQRLN